MKAKKTGQRSKYTSEQMQAAILAIKKGISIRKASALYQVPASTIRDKMSGKSRPDVVLHRGFYSILGKEIEDELVTFIFSCAERGFPITKQNLYDSVTEILKLNPTKYCKLFKNNAPSKMWIYAFLRRHPEVSQKKSEYINNARSVVTEEKIRRWFQKTKEYLGEHVAILQEPSRVFNMDETGFNLSCNGEIVLAKKGRHVYSASSNSDKEFVTTLFTVDASGKFYPPTTLFKYDRLPRYVVDAAPKGWGVGKSENGWITGETFFEYMGNVFLKNLDEFQVKRPVIVFLDGHTSHMTIHLAKFCRENEIILIALPPNATHILQPLDVTVFHPVKTNWTKIKRRFAIQNRREVTKIDLPKLLHDIITVPKMKDNIIKGFSTCGLVPFNPDTVNYDKCIVQGGNNDEENSLITQDDATQERTPQFSLQHIEAILAPQLLDKFHETQASGASGNPWTDDKDANLYALWATLSSEMKCKPPSNETEPLEVPVEMCPTSPDSSYLVDLIIEDDMAVDQSIMIESTLTDNDFIVLPFETPEPTREPTPEPSPESSSSNESVFQFPQAQGICSVKEILKNMIQCPVKAEKKKQRRNKPDYPSVLTSDDCIKLMEADKEEKERKIEDVKNRKIERLRVKEEKQNATQDLKLKRILAKLEKQKAAEKLKLEKIKTKQEKQKDAKKLKPLKLKHAKPNEEKNEAE